jgi:hypothetical protein
MKEEIKKQRSIHISDKEKNTGVTLISLVVTIIVLLILARDFNLNAIGR